MIISVITILVFTFVWVPLGGYLENQLYQDYCTTQYMDQGLIFMVWWILVGIGISVLIAYRYEVWVD